MTETTDAAEDYTEVAAYHEAGHAVIAIVLGCDFKEAAVGPTRAECYTKSETRFQIPRPGPDGLSPDDRSRIENEMVQLVAGPSAQERFTGQPVTNLQRMGGATQPGDDWHKFFRCAGVLGIDAAAAKALEDRSRALVKTHWESIEAVAAALIARRAITAREVRELISTAHGDDVAGQDDGPET